MKKFILSIILCFVCFGIAYSQNDSLITNSGWGEIKISASQKAVEKVLGKPERISPTGEVTFADYPSKGLQISYLTKLKTINAIFFYNNQRTKKDYKVFSAGKTDKGIDWNSTYEDVLKAYGKPLEDYKDEDGDAWRRIGYGDIDFLFENKKLVRISVSIKEDAKEDTK